MPIALKCTRCARGFQTPDRNIGTVARCHHCGESILVPGVPIAKEPEVVKPARRAEPAPASKCPGCGAEIPWGTVRCACGFGFRSDAEEASEQEEAEKQEVGSAIRTAADYLLIGAMLHLPFLAAFWYLGWVAATDLIDPRHPIFRITLLAFLLATASVGAYFRLRVALWAGFVLALVGVANAVHAWSWISAIFMVVWFLVAASALNAIQKDRAGE